MSLIIGGGWGHCTHSPGSGSSGLSKCWDRAGVLHGARIGRVLLGKGGGPADPTCQPHQQGSLQKLGSRPQQEEQRRPSALLGCSRDHPGHQLGRLRVPQGRGLARCVSRSGRGQGLAAQWAFLLRCFQAAGINVGPFWVGGRRRGQVHRLTAPAQPPLGVLARWAVDPQALCSCAAAGPLWCSTARSGPGSVPSRPGGRA